MHPILFKIGPVTIYSYGFMVALAFILGAYLAQLEARRENMDSQSLMDLCLGLAIWGILGARIFYILQNLKFYTDYPLQMLMLHQGGLSFYGGFISAVTFAVVYLKRKKIAIPAAFDILAPYLALAQAIGRIGCFLNGCCYGRGDYPLQIYSALNLLLIFVVLRVFKAKKPKDYFPGQIFLLYCLFYGLSRFFIEYLRGDNLKIWANLTAHQFISAGIFIAAALAWRKMSARFLLRLTPPIRV
jgi:phosphatidylglycerol:prolipoprotein diacylglycerol transferase